MRVVNPALVSAMLAISPMTVSAASLFLVPPPTLTIDGQPINTGEVTVSDFKGYQGVTEFASAKPPFTKAVTIGGTTPHQIVDDPSLPATSSFDVIMFDFAFDAVSPDISPISVRYVSNTPELIIDLPFLSSIGSFSQFTTTDDRADNIYYDLAPVAITNMAPSSAPFVDLGNGLFAELPATAVQLSSSSFQAHGGVSPVPPVPLPAGLPLLLSGLVGIVLLRRRKT